MGNSELAREKMWARIHLIPALQAEEDRDQVRRYLADKAREKELLGSETKVYNSDRYADYNLAGVIVEGQLTRCAGSSDHITRSPPRTSRSKATEWERDSGKHPQTAALCIYRTFGFANEDEAESTVSRDRINGTGLPFPLASNSRSLHSSLLYAYKQNNEVLTQC